MVCVCALVYPFVFCPAICMSLSTEPQRQELGAWPHFEPLLGCPPGSVPHPVSSQDQELQPEARQELPLSWETEAQKCQGLFQGHRAKQWQGQGWNPSPKISLHPLTLPRFCAFLCALFISTLMGVRGRVGHLLAMFCCLACLLSVVAVASGEPEAPLSEGLAECPPDPHPQFQEEERPLNWGSPRAAIPEHPCVRGRPTSNLGSGYAGKEELGHMPAVLIWGVWVPGLV